MLQHMINIILYYFLAPLLVTLTVFIALIGFEPINQIWFAYVWKAYIVPGAEKYLNPIRDELFKNMADLKSSDPELRKEKAIRVLDIGAGTGPNLRNYPKNCRLITVDNNRNFRETLLNNASKFAHITVENAFVCAAEDMSGIIEDDYCDAVVLTQVLCSATDHIAVLNEAYRTLKKGGILYIMEHVRYRDNFSFRIQQLFEPIWWYMFGSCHITRHITEQTLSNAGFNNIQLKYIEPEKDYKDFISYLGFLVRPKIFGTALK